LSNMAPEDLEIARKLCETDLEFKLLWEEHKQLKDRLEQFKDKTFLTEQEQVEIKKLKHKKLLGKDKIAMKINQHKAVVQNA